MVLGGAVRRFVLLGADWRCLAVLNGAVRLAHAAWWCLALLTDAWRCVVVLGGAWGCLTLLDPAWRCLVMFDGAGGFGWRLVVLNGA